MNPITEHEDPAASARGVADQRILSMSPDGQANAPVEVVLRNRIAEIAQAIRTKDLETLMTFYDLDVEVFDVRASLNLLGAGAYRNNLEHWFESFEGPIFYEIHSLRVVPGDRAAFCHYLGLVTGARPAGRSSGYWVRGTTCFERRDGQWLITHEHISLPRP
ncbi:MAG TPA: nuclear transport factor 2 family protein [Steroidobacteraceae bacterium]|nr:nuclear transport factor 2 family protein [Steroidobacteraceae bacterium]